MQKNPHQSRLKVRAHTSEADQQRSSDSAQGIRQHMRGAGHRSSHKSRRSGFNSPFSNLYSSTSSIVSIVKGLFAIGLITLALYWTATLPVKLLTVEKSTVTINTDAVDTPARPAIDIIAPVPAVTPQEQAISTLSDTTESPPNPDEIRLEKLPESPAEAQPVTEPTVLENQSSAQPSLTLPAAEETANTQTIEQELPPSSSKKLLSVQTYRATLFSHLTSADAIETPIQHGTEVEVLEKKGEWLNVQIKATGITGYIHQSQVN